GNGSVWCAVAVFDSVNIEPWINTPDKQSLYGSTTYFPQNLQWFPFEVENTTQRERVINLLENEIPDGNYIAFFTLMKTGYSFKPEDWAADSITLGTNIFSVLEHQGATQVRNLESGSRPYVIFYKKGGGVINEKLVDALDEVVDFSTTIAGSWDEGFFETERIGPAKKWESLHWEISSLDNIATDDYSVDVIGIDAAGADSLLLEQITALDTTLSQISASEFPYLRLRFNSRDTIQKTTIQLDHWRVFFEGLPEAALNPASFFSFSSDTLAQGENLDLEILVENIGRYDMDSLLVRYSIIDLDQNGSPTQVEERYQPLVEGDTLTANFSSSTFNLVGSNRLQIEVNPDEDQPEELFFNNVGFIDFYVETDKRNPILDVTFDGVHIMDGDLVSSRPSILITLKDENEFLALDDPSLVKVFLKSPNYPDLRQIFVDGDTLSFTPANTNSGKNRSQFLFQPELLDDGQYYLVVQATDRSGNQSGNLDYKIGFEVINKSSITNVLNYPNPFSTSTRFVFTITGSEIPENMKIQILTISGKIVREIMQEELGTIHVGNNITDFAWDGTDEYGQLLANGVYLYRVVTRKSNDESFEHRSTQSDQFFKNGFGKMVILR
ncbi:MAG: FlgD immunoglobulin-like domain containing protein, partial [Bacteroidota bacterium]